jgi:GT2 family glycosyltransferase
MRLVIVSATRYSEQEFWQFCPLGQSLSRLSFDSRIRSLLAYSNQAGLSQVYNHCLSLMQEDETALFIHDDVWIEDFALCDHLQAGLDVYDVVGIAGSKRRSGGQPAWCFHDRSWTIDNETNLSGRVGFGSYPFGSIQHYGPVPCECELLDGVLMGVRKSTLDKAGIRFDQRFDFHFYDLDFCRQLRNAGLRIGTWPICITHQSGGSYGGEHWEAGYKSYLEKWGND